MDQNDELSNTSAARGLSQSPSRYVLLAAGSNAEGQLGVGHIEDAHSWQPCRLSSREHTVTASAKVADGNERPFPPAGWRIEELSSGANHTIALLKQDGDLQQTRVYVSGGNASAQLGDHCPRGEHVATFEELALKDVLAALFLDASSGWTAKHVAAGWDWTLLALEADIAQDDVLVVLGTTNDFGQLGIGKDEQKRSGTCIHSVPLGNCLSPYRRQGDRLVIDALACGVRHTLALVTLEAAQDGKYAEHRHYVMAWGAARHGQCGDLRNLGSQLNDRSAFPKGQGTAVVWTPQVVHNLVSEHQTRSRQQPARIAVGKEHSIVLVPVHRRASDFLTPARRTDHYLSLGSNRQGQLDLPLHDAGETDCVVDVGCTWNASLLLHHEESNGQLTLSGCGAAERGQLARDPAQIQPNAKVHLATIDSGAAVRLACGSEHALLLLPNGRVLGWGWNEHGNLAQGQDDLDDRMASTSLWPVGDANDSASLPGLSRATATHVWAGCGTSFVQVRPTNDGLLN